MSSGGQIDRNCLLIFCLLLTSCLFCTVSCLSSLVYSSALAEHNDQIDCVIQLNELRKHTSKQVSCHRQLLSMTSVGRYSVILTYLACPITNNNLSLLNSLIYHIAYQLTASLEQKQTRSSNYIY